MAHEYPSTTAVARAGGATASSPAARSPLAAFQNDHEQWDVTDNSARPIPYGRFNGLFNPVTFSSRRNPSVSGRNLRAGSFSGSRPLFYSPTLGGSTRLRSQSLPHQHLVNRIADRLEVHPYRLPSSHCPRWIDPNENGLTNAKASFASGANSDD